MNFKDVSAEKILDSFLFLMLAFFALLSLTYVGKSMEFTDSCEAKCSPARSITPLMGAQEECFCDEGHGKWRHEDISRQK
jgi:hypothetical protein